MEEAAAMLPTVETIIGCPEQLSDTNGADDAIQKAPLEMCSGSKSTEYKVKDREVCTQEDNELFIYKNERKKTFVCMLCRVNLNSEYQVADHVSGRKHESFVELRKLICAAAPRGMPYRQDMLANLLYCPICAVRANSTFQMKQHIESAKHMRKVNGTSGPVNLPLPNRRAYAINAPGGPAGAPPSRYMNYPRQEPDPYYDYSGRYYYYYYEYHRDGRCYDYDYPWTGRRSDCYSRDRYDRFVDEREFRERERCYRDSRRGMSNYRGSGRSDYGARPALPPNRYGSKNYSY